MSAKSQRPAAMRRVARGSSRPALPRYLEPFFWEYDFSLLNWDEDRDLIIARVLAEGDWRAIQWLRRWMPPPELHQWIVKRQGRGLDPEHLRFWELTLSLPHRQVNAWLRVRKHDPWEGRMRG